MSERLIINVPPPEPPNRPLGRVQQYLIELRVCTGLCRELLIEIKDLLSITTLILFFLLGVWEAVRHILG
jgi:hypothetical protein